MTKRVIFATAVLLAMWAGSGGGQSQEAKKGDKEKPKAAKEVEFKDVLAGRWSLTSINARKRQISLSDYGGGDSSGAAGAFALISTKDGVTLAGVTIRGLPLAADTEISVDGKPGKVEDLKAGMILSIRMTKDSTAVTKVEATSKAKGKGDGPQTLWTVKAVDAKKKLVSVTNEKLGMTLKDIAITKDARVEVYKVDMFLQTAPLALENLKEGSIVSLEFQFDAKAGFVLSALRTSKK
jgi:hypothetical protein